MCVCDRELCFLRSGCNQATPVCTIGTVGLRHDVIRRFTALENISNLRRSSFNLYLMHGYIRPRLIDTSQENHRVDHTLGVNGRLVSTCYLSYSYCVAACIVITFVASILRPFPIFVLFFTLCPNRQSPSVHPCPHDSTILLGI